MPTYVYRCPKCGHQYETIQKITDDTRAKCPKCGTRGERVIAGGTGLIFKGSGFYITDYKKTGDKSGDAGKSEKGGETGKPRTDSTEKPAKTAKPKTKPGADS